jgi:hypothetical protein
MKKQAVFSDPREPQETHCATPNSVFFARPFGHFDKQIVF